MRETAERLLEAARAARACAYAPYSDFLVGAAILGGNGSIYRGCNVENASYGATLCAERVAVGAMVADGERRICAVAIVGGKRDGEEIECFPCGICRQVLCELATPETPVYLVSGSDVRTYTVGELLPHAFGEESMR